jgi:hypothetical protein
LNSCCIADQYHVHLRSAYRDAKMLPSLIDAIKASGELAKPQELGEAVVTQTDQLVSLLASYHGWNWGEQGPPLRKQIPELHRTIYAIANFTQADLARGISRVIGQAKSHIHSKHRTDRYDPVTSLVLREFKPIKENSVCTFAKEARMWGARPWDEKKSFEANLNDALDTLARLSRCAEKEEVDAFLIMLPVSYGTTIEELAKTMDKTLRFFADNDPSGDNCLERIGNKIWRYEFLGVPYFVQSFAPCYGSENTRFAESVNATFINFVTEFAFHRLISREEYDQTRQDIRQRAESTGRPYDIHGHEADFFVHNERAGLPPVKWVGKSFKN